jgi:hypothetical protein
MVPGLLPQTEASDTTSHQIHSLTSETPVHVGHVPRALSIAHWFLHEAEASDTTPLSSPSNSETPVMYFMLSQWRIKAFSRPEHQIAGRLKEHSTKYTIATSVASSIIH